jgi:hypothetical protein
MREAPEAYAARRRSRADRPPWWRCEDARLALFGIDDEIPGRTLRSTRAFPLDRGREEGTAAPPQSRRLDRLDDGKRIAARERVGQRGVAAVADRVSDVAWIHEAAARRQLPALMAEEVADGRVRPEAASAASGEPDAVGRRVRQETARRPGDDGHNRRGPAEATAACRHDPRAQAPPHDFVMKRCESLPRRQPRGWSPRPV